MDDLRRRVTVVGQVEFVPGKDERLWVQELEAGEGWDMQIGSAVAARVDAATPISGPSGAQSSARLHPATQPEPGGEETARGDGERPPEAEAAEHMAGTGPAGAAPDRPTWEADLLDKQSGTWFVVKPFVINK